MEKYKDELIPAWVNFDNQTMKLQISTPEVSASTNFTFKIKSENEDGLFTPMSTVISLNVMPCSLDN